MKHEIITRLIALGATVDTQPGLTVEQTLCAINFQTVLYPKPKETPWATASEQEPISGLNDFLIANRAIYETNKEQFFSQLFDQYFQLIKEPLGQFFWLGQPFTPFWEGSENYEQWYTFFEEETNIEVLTKRAGEQSPDFIHVMEAYSYPDYYFVLTNDPEPDNPIVFSTTTEEFFQEIENEGTLEQFLNGFWTKEELRDEIERVMQTF